ncbi:cobalt-zinc-cadmium efflux RND transporter membrane fusion protein of CzcB family [alpha proteobacterium U9-1i]|nr:cobalt-zinc-cadmium efflux RND transporter membrane fusion protein of CzcB family [alpha proteobacterium U9-1i]
MSRSRHAWLRAAIAGLALSFATACGGASPADEHEEEAAEYERGPHRGRMLRDGDFAIEMTIFEDGVPPEFHVYAYRNDRPIDPREVQLTVSLTRLGGQVDSFTFAPQEDYLKGAAVVTEPHSFDVAVRAVSNGETHDWAYESYEGRTTIGAEQAEAAGIRVEAAGPATLEETVALAGRVELQPQGRAEITAWYPGRIVRMNRAIGDRVRRGETLASVTSSESLQTYGIPSPISGVVMSRDANVGDVAGAAPIYVIADATQVHAEFYVYPRDAERLRAGQPVTVRSLSGDHNVRADIEAILPTADMMTQTIVAHVDLPNADSTWRPGQAVEGAAVVSQQDVPLAVRTRALQRFRDFTVVFARVGDTYEVRMLELGRQTPEWTEVLGGLRPGEVYVIDNAFLIRADIEKSGASHDH